MAANPNITASGFSIADVSWGRNDDIVKFVKSAMEDKRSYNQAFEQQAYQNIAWYLGMQDLWWSNRAKFLERRPIDRRRVNLVYNLILPYVDTLCAKLGAEQVNYEAVPATDDQEDFDRAYLGTQVMRYYADILRQPEMEEQSDRWASITGECYIKVIWDSEKGTKFDAAKELGLDEDEFFKKYKAEKDMAQGDVDAYPVSPLNIFWGPYGCEFDDADWVLEVNERSRSYVEKRYNVSEETLTKAVDSEATMVYRMDDIGQTGVNRHKSKRDTVVVQELWVKPEACGKKDGYRAIVIADQVVKKGPNPYWHRKFPYEQFRMLLAPGRSHGHTYVTSLLGPQSDLNRSMSQQVEARETVAMPWILAPQGSIVNREEWNGRAGGLRHFSGSIPPTIQQGATYPASVLAQLKQTETFMQDIIGAHDVSRAKVPTGVKSGRAILALQEADESRLAPVRRRRRAFWERVGRLILSTAAQFVTEERCIRILGDDDEYQAIRFKGSDLGRPNDASYYDVRVTTMGLPASRVAAADMVDMLLERQVLNPIKDARLIMDSLGISGLRKSLDPTRIDKAAARFENEVLESGENIEPRSYDDHETHIAEHEMAMKTGKARFWPPEIQALYVYHIQAHKNLMADKAIEPQILLQQAQVRAIQRGLLSPPQPVQPGQPQNSGAPTVDRTAAA